MTSYLKYMFFFLANAFFKKEFNFVLFSNSK
jgi:hypothetical protein